MRLADPFGRAAPIAQVWIEVRPAAEPSAIVRRIGGPKPPKVRILPRMVAALFLLVTLLAVVLALLTWALGAFR